MGRRVAITLWVRTGLKIKVELVQVKGNTAVLTKFEDIKKLYSVLKMSIQNRITKKSC